MKKLIFTLTALSFYVTVQSQSWSLTGNSGTNPSVNFLGTTDSKPLKFRVANEYAGEIDFSISKTAFGYAAGKNIITGTHNTAIGYRSQYLNNGGSFNTANGSLSLYNNTGSYNTTVRYGSLYSNTSANANAAIGFTALFTNT